jgi:hypothetical protein
VTCVRHDSSVDRRMFETSWTTSSSANTAGVDEDERPPICQRCGVTMLPVELSADDEAEGEWVCIECEELGERE